MAIPAIYILIWGVAKLVISDKTVNTAVDHWTKGTSNRWDDLVWRVLEIAAGIEDHDLKVLTLNAGVADITARYVAAKEAGTEALYKKPTRTPIPPDYIRALMSGDYPNEDMIA